jgi:Tfp pilus assembly protein PilZ
MDDPARKREIARDRVESGTRRIRRHAERVSIKLTVVVEHTAGSFEGTALDIGFGGMFVESNSVPTYGDRVDIVLTLPTGPDPLRLPGLVRWTKEQGFGLQFLELGARETYAIARLLESVKGSQLA